VENPGAMKVVSLASVVVALLQSLCTAVLTINGFRLAIGLAAMAAGTIWEPVRAFHHDAIRIPMLILAVIGASVNLAVLFWIWRLRARPEGQWRRREIPNKQRRSERLQAAMAVLTLVLVGAESWAHVIQHRRHVSAAAAAQFVHSGS
jgi:hypothetical protein